ncbi:MAG: ABC transporter substrate-binding protein [Geodermatophilaceae bacterium]|nr:ABC transporter substrate-binding protein [Geodermatophilaceae bacterium]
MRVRSRFTVSGMLALTLFAAACSAPPSQDSGDSNEGGTVVVARSGDIDNLDPHLATAFQTIEALELVYDTLFELDPDLVVQPGLAESWEYSEDGMTLTIVLREGVTFHDGDTFDSADVKASIERILDEATGAVVRTNLLSIAEVQTPDEQTVVLELSEPDGTLPSALTSTNTAMVSEAAVEAGTVDNEPNGTGPFVFDDWRQGEVLSLTANEDYWGDGPFVDGVEIRVVPEESSILAGMRADEFQMGILGDPAVVDQVGDDLTVERTPELGYFPFFLNSERAPLDKVEARQAIACAIDRQQLIDAAAFGEGEPTGPLATPYDTGVFDGLPCDETDPELARELLADAGVPDGFTIETIVIQGENDAAINVAQSIQSQLAEIGINLELVPLETNVYVDRWLAADFDSALSQNGSSVDPQITYAKYFTSTGNFQNVAKFTSPELDQLFADGKASTDPDERIQIYGDIGRILLEGSPWVWLYSGYKYQVLQPELTDFVPMPTGSLKSLRQVHLGS